MTRHLVAVALALAALSGLARPASAAPYSIARWTLDNGGGSRVQAPPYVLSGTAGQPDPGRLINRTYRIVGGFWGGGVSSSVDVPPTAPGPGTVTDAINPATPNPFAATTRVPFALSAPGRVEVRVFDVRGALVRTLESGELAAGQHVRTRDGRNDAGDLMRPGVYLLRVRIPARGDVQKLVILR
jgi:hypothetical protein